jgi:hypothetical protein
MLLREDFEMPKVYIINKSSHDFSEAERFGELVYLSEGPINRYAVNDIHRQFFEILKLSSPDDFIVSCSLNIMNIIATTIFVHQHKKLNLLLFKDGEYIERNICYDNS